MIEAEKYARDVVSGELVVGHWIKQAAKRFLSDLEREDIYFDLDEASRVVDFIENFCCHWEGKWAGKPMKLEEWQKFIVQQIFAWKSVKTGLRRVRSVYIQIARKNGKSLLLAAVALYHLFIDKENAPQIYVGSNNEDQAKICVNSAGQVIKNSPKLRWYLTRGKVELFHYRKKVHSLVNNNNNGLMACLTSDAGTKDGFNPSLGIIDEYHEAPTDDMYNVLESGQGAREQPLIVTITTAGFNKSGPCYSKLRDSSTKMLDGKITDDSHLAFIYEMDPEDDWKNQANWFKSSPNWGISVLPGYMETRYTKAINDGGSKEVDFKTKNLNLWVDAEKVWIQDQIWLKNTHELSVDDLIGKTCYGGLDCAKSVDLNAFCLIFPGQFEKKGKEIIPILPFFWIPSEKVKTTNDKVDYVKWIKEGHIIQTEGNIVDYNFIEEDIVRVVDQYDFRGIDYDHAYAGNVAANLANRGYELTPLGQSHGTLTGATEEVERLAIGNLIEHFRNPVMRWMIGNVLLNRNAKGYVMPDKAKSQHKIDGVSAMVNAIARWKRISGEQKESTIIWL